MNRAAKRALADPAPSVADAGPLRRPKGIIFDIDGTLALTDRKTGAFHLLPGAAEVVARASALGIRLATYTNGTFHTPAHYHRTLLDLGLDFPAGSAMTPASVAAEVMRSRRIKRVMVLGGEGVSQPLIDVGIDVTGPGDRDARVDAVLVGWFPEFGLAALEAACEAIWAGAMLYSVSNAPVFAAAGGRKLGVSGAICAMITHTTGKRAILMGKPAPHGLKIAARQMGIAIADLAVIGDDPALEIRMARAAGATAIGVTTGLNDHTAFESAPESIRASSVFSSLEALLASGYLD
jgi:NagD protein